jgi:hypothetical protein
MGGPSEREYIEKLSKIKQKLSSKAIDIKNEFEKIEKTKVDLLKKTKEMKHNAENEIHKMEEGITKSKDLAPESKRRLQLEIDATKGGVQQQYSELEMRITEAIVPVARA